MLKTIFWLFSIPVQTIGVGLQLHEREKRERVYTFSGGCDALGSLDQLVSLSPTHKNRLREQMSILSTAKEGIQEISF